MTTSTSEAGIFGALLRQHRLAASLSQEQLGERAQLSANAVAALERGRRRAPRPGTVILLADALRLTPAERDALISAATPARLDGLAHPGSMALPLPTGTVTFLFTDIESSTRLWEQHRAVMREVLTRHDALIEGLVAEHEGVLLRPRGEGDSRFAVFGQASGAVAAAAAIQVALLDEPWQLAEPLRVRMALHTGEADLRHGDYHGSPVNRCARLRAIGHGGQTILSQVTADLVRDVLPAEVGLRDLGQHQLKDLERPERVWQLLHPELPAEFPPLASLAARRHNLPVQLSSFVGRDRQVGEVRQLLGCNRLVALVGAGGVGKTRLALQVAHDLLAEYPDGVWLVDLAPLAEPTLVPQALAVALGVLERPGRQLIETLAQALGSGRVLVVLDNCEHLVAACRAVAAQLLAACTHLCLLASSREPLGVPGEVVWRVPSLPVPDLDEEGTPLEDLVGVDAVRLFTERASAALPGFAVGGSNAADVAQICRRLDGMPLAIELAAAWVRMLSPREIALHLDDRFKLLVGGSPMAAERQRTLRAAVSWSYDLLRPEQQTLFARLSVFSGGFTLQAAEAVCADGVSLGAASVDLIPAEIAPSAVRDVLSRLVDQSLVLVEPPDEQAETRYRLLETLRAYSWERLVAHGEANLLRKRHTDWLLGLAEQAATAFHGPRQGHWLRWAEREHDNIRAALHWALERDDADTALRLTAALIWSWALHVRWSEARIVFERVLAVPGAHAPTSARASVLVGAGTISAFLGDLRAAGAYLDEGLAISRAIGDERIAIDARGLRTMIYQFHGEFRAAQAENEALLPLARQAGHTWAEVRCLEFLARVAARNGAPATAAAQLDEAERLARAAGDIWNLAGVLSARGDLERSNGEHARAGRLYLESQVLFADLGPGEDPSLGHNLGYVALAAGEPAQAAVNFARALARFRRLGDPRGAAECLIGLAGVLAAATRLEEAARLFGSGEAALEAVGSGLYSSNLADYARWLAVVRAGLDRAAFAAAWAEGRAWSLEQAIARVAPIQRSLGQSPVSPQPTTLLTARETEVARLVARGLTNRQVAEALVVTNKTAANHVQRILDRLGVHSRAQLAARAAEFGLQKAVSPPAK